MNAESLEADDASNWFGNGQANKGNFDLDCINNNNNEGGQGGGATGPQGPQGERGERGFNGTQGLPGPAGPNQITTANKFKQFGPNVTSIPTGLLWIANSTATCLPGDIVLSGGYRVNVFPPNSNLFLFEQSTETEPTSTKDGWTTEIKAGNRFSLVSIAECFDNP